MAIDKTQILTAIISAGIGALATFATTYYTTQNEKSKILISDKTESLVKILEEKKKIEISFFKNILKQKCYNEYQTMKEEAILLDDRNKRIDTLIEEINKLSK